ncbi:MAG: glycosyltransferase family 87 protein [Saprospiraceae bacterium]
MVKLKQWISDYRVIAALFVLIAIFVSIEARLSGKKTFEEGGFEYNRYNNYTIFKQSWFHLIDGKDLYVLYPQEHWDLYKYSPTFSLLFGSLAYFSDPIGLALWDILNSLLLVFAVWCIPKLTNYQKGLILLICIFESTTALQSEQSNHLMAGLIILAFALCEREKFFLAALCIALSAYIKIFGIVAFALFLFYPQKLKPALYSVICFVALFFLPLIVISFDQLKHLYDSWLRMLSADLATNYGISLVGWLKSWVPFSFDKRWITLAGIVFFVTPFTRIKMYRYYAFRFLALSSVLIWVVIFNNRAESPSYVIAMAGAGIWFVTAKKNAMNISLFLFVMLLTSLSSSDLYPRMIRKEYIEPFALKALPSVLIWVKIVYEMITMKKGESESMNGSEPVPHSPDTLIVAD